MGQTEPHVPRTAINPLGWIKERAWQPYLRDLSTVTAAYPELRNLSGPGTDAIHPLQNILFRKNAVGRTGGASTLA